MADYSTYARIVLSNSESISNLIRKYSIVPIETKYVADTGLSHLTVLTNKEISEAFLNPQNSIKSALPVYADITQTHRDIITSQQDAYQQQLFIEESARKIQEKASNADKKQQKSLQDAIKKLEKYYRELTTFQKQLGELETQLFDFERKLSSYTIVHDQDWDQFRINTLQAITQDLIARNIPLTDAERKELENPESIAEIIRRYKTLELAIPSEIPIDNPDFTTYFELKAYLAIHTSLSRRMLPNSPADIAKL